MKNPFKGLSKYLLLFLIGVGLIAVYKTFDNLGVVFSYVSKFFSILMPFIIGLVIAFVLYIPVSFLEKQFKKAKANFFQNHARIISVAIVYVVVIILIVVLFVFGLPSIVRGVSSFVVSIPDYYKQVVQWLDPFISQLNLPKELDVTVAMESFYNSYIVPNLTTENVLNSINSVVSVASSFINVLLAFVVSVYMLISRENLVRYLKVLLELFIPKKHMSTLIYYTKRSSQILYTYIYSQVLDALIVAILMSVGLLIFKAPNAIVLGFLIGAMNMIPYFGAFIGGGAAVVIVLINNGWVNALVVGIYIIVMQQIDANILQPKIVGTTIGIKPIYVLLAITLGGGFFGIAGIFLGVPCMAIIQMLLKDYITYKEALKTHNKQHLNQENLSDNSSNNPDIDSDSVTTSG